MTNIKTINDQFQEFIGDVSEVDLREIETKLRAKYPDNTDDFWVNWWVARIAFFTHGVTDFDFNLIGDYLPIDPDTIQLSFNPDYGS